MRIVEMEMEMGSDRARRQQQHSPRSSRMFAPYWVVVIQSWILIVKEEESSSREPLELGYMYCTGLQ